MESPEDGASRVKPRETKSFKTIESQDFEKSPAYQCLRDANLLTTAHRVSSIDALDMIVANSDRAKNLRKRFVAFFKPPIIGLIIYKQFHLEFFVPAGHVQCLINKDGGYLIAGPGIHLINTYFTRLKGQPLPLRGHIVHGYWTIVVVQQGHVGVAWDAGQPIVLPPGLHQWKSHTMDYQREVDLEDHLIDLDPYTLLTVDEGYAAVTQNNGKQMVLPGGGTYFLNHRNWKFENFMPLKIQTDNLEKIEATSSDNIIMNLTSTVMWRIIDVDIAARMAMDTMSVTSKRSGAKADISKLRNDVLKQAIASLASFIGTVNFSDTFHFAALAQAKRDIADDSGFIGLVSRDNPVFDTSKIQNAIEHANETTKTYGVQIMSINIISADPKDANLTRALASGAVAAAEALQAETTARGVAKAKKIQADNKAETDKIVARGSAEAEIITARGTAEAERIRAQGTTDASLILEKSILAQDLSRMEKTRGIVGTNSKFFFSQTPEHMSHLKLKLPQG